MGVVGSQASQFLKVLADPVVRRKGDVIRFQVSFFACDDVTALTCFGVGKESKGFIKSVQDHQCVADHAVIFNEGAHTDGGKYTHDKDNQDSQAKAQIREVVNGDTLHRRHPAGQTSGLTIGITRARSDSGARRVHAGVSPRC